MAKGEIGKKEILHPDPITDTTINYELAEDYFRNIANRTVKPVIERLKGVYYKYGKRYPWNHIMGLGLQLYKFHRKGKDITLQFAKMLNDYGLPDNVLRDIVEAIDFEGKATRGRR